MEQYGFNKEFVEQLKSSLLTLKTSLEGLNDNLSVMAKDPKIAEEMKKPENVKKVEELAKLRDQLFNMAEDGSNNK